MYLKTQRQADRANLLIRSEKLKQSNTGNLSTNSEGTPYFFIILYLIYILEVRQLLTVVSKQFAAVFSFSGTMQYI